jgi:hypothetical protein
MRPALIALPKYHLLLARCIGAATWSRRYLSHSKLELANLYQDSPPQVMALANSSLDLH